MQLCFCRLDLAPVGSGLLRHLLKTKNDERLESLRNSDGQVCCVFICGDRPLAYLDEYSNYVSPELFPAVQNSKLLKSNE